MQTPKYGGVTRPGARWRFALWRAGRTMAGAMFVLLKHETDDGVHWDFMVELPGEEELATWRLSENPSLSPERIRAERIGDHRRAYLEYEGELSRGRGRVRRVDRGDASIESVEGENLRATLRGEALSARIEISRHRDGTLCFRVERQVIAP